MGLEPCAYASRVEIEDKVKSIDGNRTTALAGLIHHIDDNVKVGAEASRVEFYNGKNDTNVAARIRYYL